MKVLVFVVMSLFFIGCVSSDSSDTKATSTSDGTGGTGTDTNDTNSSDDGSNIVVVDDSSTAGFSKTDAEEDPNACIINSTFQVMDDSSFDPLSNSDNENGVVISSQYDYSTDLEATKIVLFYPDLDSTLVNSMVHVYEDEYTLSFDRAWVSNSIPMVYIRTPKDSSGAHSCFRYELDTLNDNSMTRQKVYR